MRGYAPPRFNAFRKSLSRQLTDIQESIGAAHFRQQLTLALCAQLKAASVVLWVTQRHHSTSGLWGYCGGRHEQTPKYKKG